MNLNTIIGIIGGDSRQLHMAVRLQKNGYKVRLTGFDLAQLPKGLQNYTLSDIFSDCGILILPLPVSRDEKTLNASFADNSIALQTIIQEIPPETHVLCGMPPQFFKKTLEAKHCKVSDYFSRDDLTLQNALLTAEGIIGIMTEQLPCTVFGLPCAITGYGRVAKYTARALHALGAKVTVFARDPLAVIQAQTDLLDAKPLSHLKKDIHRFSCIINTVPSPIITKDILTAADGECILIEVASAPFGIDANAAKECGMKLIKGVSLPGKTAPKTAGEIIAATIDKMLTEGST